MDGLNENYKMNRRALLSGIVLLCVSTPGPDCPVACWTIGDWE